MKTIIATFALLATTLTVSACDEPDDEGTVQEQQLDQADLRIEDALTIAADDEEDAVVVEAVFEAGAESGWYEVTVVVGDEAIVYEIDARTAARVQLARRLASAEHRRRAQLHRRLRHRLADAIGEHRRDHANLRVVFARLLDAEVELETLDRGVRERLRLALAESSSGSSS